MELVQNLYDFFGIELLTESATFVDLVNSFVQIGLALWIVLFIMRSIFLLCTVPDRRFM